MNNRTFKTIVILVALLFVNIEAAQAGLVRKIKVYILHEFSDLQLFYISAGVLCLGFLVYVLLAPVIIGNHKSVWLDYYPGGNPQHSYQDKKVLVKKISSILNNH